MLEGQSVPSLYMHHLPAHACACTHTHMCTHSQKEKGKEEAMSKNCSQNIARLPVKGQRKEQRQDLQAQAPELPQHWLAGQQYEIRSQTLSPCLASD